MQPQKMQLPFFLGDDVLQISRRLLGCRLMTRIFDESRLGAQEELTGGIIVEVEAYAGARDRASHSFGNRRSKRTEVMFLRGGLAYVYLCYGIHCLFNIVTNEADCPDAVLVRAIEPVLGLDLMLKRREKVALDFSLTAGPGSLCRALGIELRHSGTSLLGDEIWIEPGPVLKDSAIASGPRIGVDYAGKDAELPWRFWIKDSQWLSRPSRRRV